MFKLCWHCWHHIEESRRKIKAHNSCRELGPYVAYNHVKYKMKKHCCKCGKVKDTEIYENYDIQRGLTYPNYEDN